VLVDVSQNVARITINRPERRNAMSWEVVCDLRSAIASARRDPEVQVVVLTGAGDEAFCSGADLGSMSQGTATGSGAGGADVSVPSATGSGTGAGARETSDASKSPFLEQHEARGEVAALFEDLWGLGKPTIARVQGWAMAGGFGLALACDLVVASERARFGAPEINVGLWPFMITVPLMRSMPAKKALELMLTGRQVDAAEAERIGFVTRVVAHDGLDRAVEELASALASKSPSSMKLGRDSFYRTWDMDMNSGAALDHLHAMLTLTNLTEDAKEGMAAFLDKRPPEWRGRRTPE
jgi:enoyl-CoA hydratase/carnithine racemase